MKLEFLSEDFDHRKHPDLNGLYLADACALVANQKLERYLKDEARIVWSSNDDIWYYPSYFLHNQTQKYQAILINIEEIPKKECEHKDMRYWLGINEDGMFSQCQTCGVKLKAKWEVIE